MTVFLYGLLTDPYVEAWKNINSSLSDNSREHSITTVGLQVLRFLKGVFLLIPFFNIVVYKITASPVKTVSKAATLKSPPVNIFLSEVRSNDSKSASQKRAAFPGGFLPTKEQEKTVHFIVTSLATKNSLWLSMNASNMERKGKSIENLHSLAFLHCIFQDKDCKNKHMPKILDSWIIKQRFLSDLSKNLTKAVKHQSFQRYLSAFMSSLNIAEDNREKIIHWIRTQRNEEFLRFLIAH
ncbi:MAG: hypothetical protein COT84_03710 [Chlamydiae bacterium CG10_big_fil_rev_8_21_14_0_10_35_9]|nr:MAG: hypothetical protein COT84_03710 [Chlamydiae bacterium CG10_big_fil_rev_8_21_14_0_10_35_9]